MNSPTESTMVDDKIDLEIALQKLHELAYEDGDLGCEYWKRISRLLKRAGNMQDEINVLSAELELCRAKLSAQASERKGKAAFSPRQE